MCFLCLNVSFYEAGLLHIVANMEHTSAQDVQTSASSTCNPSLDRQDNGAYDGLDLLIAHESCE